MRMLHKDTLGTRLTFDVYEFETLHGDMLQQYIISLGGGQDGSPMGSSLYRIAPDSRDVTEWRIDVSRGSMFNRFHGPWDPITPRKFSSPREAGVEAGFGAG